MIKVVARNHAQEEKLQEILEMYKEIIDPNFTWVNMSLEDQDKILLAGRSNNILDTNKLKKLYPNIKNIKDSIRHLFNNIKNSS